MSGARSFGRWLTNWRNPATLVAAVFVTILAITVMDSISTRDRAFDAQQRTVQQALDARQAATRRIDALTGEINRLQQSAEENGQRIAELVAQVAALQEQIRRMGGQPIVVEPAPARPSTTTTTTVRPVAPQPPPTSPTTTTTTTMAPTPPPSTPFVCAPIIGCHGGKLR